ncbi:DUF86 domain-containing protein [Nanoarchaeota archaeon]
MKDDLIFIKHILESINAIEEFSKDIDKKELKSNRLKQSAIVREIEIIGEATKNISDSLKDKYPEIPWREISGTRDKIIHNYFGVDLNIIWDIIKLNLPVLKKQLSNILKQ